MQRTFVMLPEFDRRWKDMGLNDDDLRRLENQILQDPEAGVLMQGYRRAAQDPFRVREQRQKR